MSEQPVATGKPDTLSVALRARWVTLSGPLEGHSIRARPLSGVEQIRLADLSLRIGTADAVQFALRSAIVEWKQPDNRLLEVTDRLIAELPTNLLLEIRRALDSLFRESAFRANESFFGFVSGTSSEDTAST